MSSKWTEKLVNLFKLSQSKKLDPLEENAIGGEKNPRTLLAKKIMKVMKDPYPSPEQEESKKPKP